MNVNYNILCRFCEKPPEAFLTPAGKRPCWHNIITYGSKQECLEAAKSLPGSELHTQVDSFTTGEAKHL